MTSQAIEDLNALLRRELAAVDTYSEVITRIDDSHASRILDDCKDSHVRRAKKLERAIAKLGGTPEQGTGMWGSLSKLLADGTATLGDGPTIAMLEEGEDLESGVYEWRLVRMHGDHRHLVKDELWPEQQKTKEKMSELLKGFTGGAWPPVPDDKAV